MLKNKYIKITVSCFLVALALWIAVPKVFIHELFHHDHSQLNISKETKVQSQQSTEDCDFEKYNKPVYFNIFKFVSKIAPFKPKSTIEFSQNKLRLPGVSVLISLLRAPPVAE